jgi:hypothetical protein
MYRQLERRLKGTYHKDEFYKKVRNDPQFKTVLQLPSSVHAAPSSLQCMRVLEGARFTLFTQTQCQC